MTRPVIEGLATTAHAAIRQRQRRIDSSDVALAVAFGDKFHCRNAVIHVLSRRRLSALGIPDATRLNGLHVVLSHTGQVITTYRNPNFHRKDFARARWRK